MIWVRAWPRSASGPRSFARGFASQTTTSSSPIYACDLNEEPLQCYRPGGYPPIHIGDTLKQGRYKILHKLGWGAFSTVWAARDEETSLNIALKTLQSAAQPSRELATLQHLQRHPHPALPVLHDTFSHPSPNGTHTCLALALTGPSIKHFLRPRLPPRLLKPAMRHTLQGLAHLHAHSLAHGDVHTHNLVLSLPSLPHLCPAALHQALGGAPTTSPVHPPGGPQGCVPRHLVASARFARSSHGAAPAAAVALVDLGASFAARRAPGKLLTPLDVRPPEVLLGTEVDWRVDLWAVGCMIFELVCGRAVVDVRSGDAGAVLRQWARAVGDEVPVRWRGEMPAGTGSAPGLQQRLAEDYFERGQEAEFSREEIARIGDIVARLVRLEPERRASAEEILRDPWFD